MPDISKCANHNCPSKNDCYRYMSKSSDVQAWGNFGLLQCADKCDYFVQISERIKVDQDGNPKKI